MPKDEKGVAVISYTNINQFFFLNKNKYWKKLNNFGAV